MLKYYFAAFLSVFLTAISQLLFKLGANCASRRSVFFVYINPYSLSAYTILLAVTLLSVYAYTKLPVKLAVVLLPFTYILVGLFSFLFLKEKITRTRLIGTGIIIMGICIFGSAGIAGSCSWPYGKDDRPEQSEAPRVHEYWPPFTQAAGEGYAQSREATYEHARSRYVFSIRHGWHLEAAHPGDAP